MAIAELEKPLEAVKARNAAIVPMPADKCDQSVGKGVGFERIRRITGYLVGDLNRFNNAIALKSMTG